MKKIGVLIVLSLGCFSCSLIKKASPEYSSPYSLHFSKISELRGMKGGRYGMGYTTDGKYLYAVNGSSRAPFYTTDIIRYDIESDEWSVLTDKLTPKRYVSAEYVAGKIYVLNGYGPSFEINEKVEVVDSQTGEIIYLKDNPSPVSFSGTAVWNEKIYVFGGMVGERYYYNQIYVFDPVTGNWTLLGVIPENKHARGEIVDGVLYIFGGYNGQVSSRIDAYNIAHNTWYFLGDMPVGISANAITKHGDFIWLVGSYNNLSSLAVFNTKTREFNLVKSNMYGRRHAAAKVVNNKLYVYGGNRASGGSFLSSIQVADLKEIENQLTRNQPDVKR